MALDPDISGRRAIQFVILLGVVSLLADVTYEGARSVIGPYLALLGASGTVVGVVAGAGELIGYSIRLISGYLTDRTRKYWTITVTGYAINLLAVPLLALAGSWQVAAALIVAERMGKAIRTPARDAMLSHATAAVGRGWGFGLHEAMDQIGAILGPLIAALVLHLHRGYQTSFAIFLIPAILALTVLMTARFLYPHPQEFEITMPQLERKGFVRSYWIYLVAAALIAAAYTDFPLIAFHLKKANVASDEWIPILYAIAMGVDALAALFFGRMFDRQGFSILIVAVLISAFFAPLVFFGASGLVLAGIACWGAGMGAQESIIRAAVANMVPPEKRGSAYGIFNTGYGIAWFLGSAFMGFLYGVSIPALVVFSVSLQLLSIPLLWWVHKEF